MSKVMQVRQAKRLGNYFAEKWDRLSSVADPNDPIETFCIVSPTTWVNGPLLDGMVQARIARDDGVVHEQVEIQLPVPLEGVRLPDWFGPAQPLASFSRLEAPFLSLSNEYDFLNDEAGATPIGLMLSELIEILVPLSESARVPDGWHAVREELLESELPLTGGEGGRIPIRINGQNVRDLRDELELNTNAPLHLVEEGVNARALSVNQFENNIFHIVGWLPRAIYLDVEYEASIGFATDPMNSQQFDEVELANVPPHLRIEIGVSGSDAADSAVAEFFKDARSVELHRGTTSNSA